MYPQQDKPHTLLVVEDSPEDFFALQRGLQAVGLDTTLVHCDTGEKAMDYLLNPNAQANKPAIPDLVLLDLNLPGLSGGEVLEAIKTHHRLKTIPVVIITTSRDNQDIQSSYRNGANSYICKSLHETRMLQDMQRLKDYWFDTVILPAHGGAQNIQ